MKKRILLILITFFTIFSFSNNIVNATAFVWSWTIINLNTSANEEIFTESDIQEIVVIEIMIGWLIMIIFNILIPFQWKN